MNNIFENSTFGKVYKTGSNKAWVAKDKDGTLRCFTLVKPWRDYDCAENEQRWITDENTNTECILPSDLFPQFNNLSWEDEPVEVNLVSLCSISISEEKISKLAWEYVDSIDIPCRYEETAVEGYKAGCRKILEILK